MDLYSYLDEMQRDVWEGNATKIERRYFELCARFASIEEARRIQHVQLDEYLRMLEQGLSESLRLANESTKAIYFEYDIDHEWSSSLFLCDNYNELEDQDDDWACEWSDYVEGPSLPEFADMCSERGFDRSERALGITLYLIARTVVAFTRACANVESSISFCIAFHDQDPIMRVGKRER